MAVLFLCGLFGKRNEVRCDRRHPYGPAILPHTGVIQSFRLRLHTLDVNQNVYTKAALHRRTFAVNVLDQALRKSLMEPNGASTEGEAG